MVYDSLAQEYAERVEHYKHVTIQVAAPFIKALEMNFANVHVLELGCGAGLNLMYFEHAGFKSTAVEISGKMISFSRRIAPKTKYIHANILEYTFPNVKYEGIFAHAFIHLFKTNDLERLMVKIMRLLVDGGMLFISTTKHEEADEGYITKHDYKSINIKRYRKQWTEGELLHFFGRYDLQIVFHGEIDESDKGKLWMYFVLKKCSPISRGSQL